MKKLATVVHTGFHLPQNRVQWHVLKNTQWTFGSCYHIVSLWNLERKKHIVSRLGGFCPVVQSQASVYVHLLEAGASVGQYPSNLATLLHVGPPWVETAVFAGSEPGERHLQRRFKRRLQHAAREFVPRAEIHPETAPGCQPSSQVWVRDIGSQHLIQLIWPILW